MHACRPQGARCAGGRFQWMGLHSVCQARESESPLPLPSGCSPSSGSTVPCTDVRVSVDESVLFSFFFVWKYLTT